MFLIDVYDSNPSFNYWIREIKRERESLHWLVVVAWIIGRKRGRVGKKAKFQIAVPLHFLDSTRFRDLLITERERERERERYQMLWQSFLVLLFWCQEMLWQTKIGEIGFIYTKRYINRLFYFMCGVIWCGPTIANWKSTSNT